MCKIMITGIEISYWHSGVYILYSSVLVAEADERRLVSGKCGGTFECMRSYPLSFYRSLRRLIFHRRFEINENLFNHDSGTAGIR